MIRGVFKDMKMWKTFLYSLPLPFVSSLNMEYNNPFHYGPLSWEQKQLCARHGKRRGHVDIVRVNF